MTSERPTPAEFEKEVQRLAEALWRTAGGSELVGGTRIDCVVRTEDVTHLVECTTERTIDKVREDVNKLIAARTSEEKLGNLVRCWMIVLDDPSPSQRATATQGKVKLLTIAQLADLLVKAPEYTRLRGDYRFGSVADPVTGKYDSKSVRYLPCSMHEARTGKTLHIHDVVERLARDTVVVLLGDFGTGKSIAIRQMFFELAKRSERLPVPIVANLRDHWGQQSVEEVLSRHARSVGFQPDYQLYRAWRAGRATVFLDGFDELAFQPWSPSQARMVRRASVAAVRDFVRSRPPGSTLLLAGREHYFDNEQELRVALDLPPNAAIIRLEDFDEQEAQSFLRAHGKQTDLPQWLPRRGLLLAYLVETGLLDAALEEGHVEGMALAWRNLVERVMKREASISAAMEATVIQHILERLATLCRSLPDGDGPVLEADLRHVFREVTGVEPQYDTLTLMLRLPWLASSNREDGARHFVDRDALNTLWGGEVARFATDPRGYPFPERRRWLHAMSELGIAVAASKLSDAGMTARGVVSAAKVAANVYGCGTLALDLVGVAQQLQDDSAPLDCQGLWIREGDCDVLDLESHAVQNLTASDCLIGTLRLPVKPPVGVALERCLVPTIEGIGSSNALPDWIKDSKAERFDSTGTTAGIMALNRPLRVRVALTILKKVFLQRGSGRQESALFRGLDQEARQLVEPTLAKLEQLELIWRSVRRNLTIYHPIRSKMPLIQRIVEGRQPELDDFSGKLEA